MKVIKSNTWKDDSICVIKRNSKMKIKTFTFQNDLHIPVTDIFLKLFYYLLFFFISMVLIFIPIIGWYMIYRINIRYKRRFTYELTDTVSIEELENIEVISEENAYSVLSKAGWGVAGSALLGPAGLLAGALAKGNNKRVTAIITFTDNRRALISCNQKILNELAITQIVV